MILPAGQTKGKIQSNGGAKEVKEESKKVERIVPIILNGREEGRSRSRERAPNPFLSGSKGSEGLKSKQEKEKASNGTSSSPAKIAPLATAEVVHTNSVCSHTFTTSMFIPIALVLLHHQCSSVVKKHCFGLSYKTLTGQRCNDPLFILSSLDAPFEPRK